MDMSIGILLIILTLTAMGTGIYKLQARLEHWDQQRHFKD